MVPSSNPGKGWRIKYTPYCLCIFVINDHGRAGLSGFAHARSGVHNCHINYIYDMSIKQSKEQSKASLE